MEDLQGFEAATAGRVQVEGKVQNPEAQLDDLREALRELEYRQEILRDMLAQVGDQLPAGVRDRAEAWSQQDLRRALVASDE